MTDESFRLSSILVSRRYSDDSVVPIMQDNEHAGRRLS